MNLKENLFDLSSLEIDFANGLKFGCVPIAGNNSTVIIIGLETWVNIDYHGISNFIFSNFQDVYQFFISLLAYC